jgi:endo-1,4-beta-xylanase
MTAHITNVMTHFAGQCYAWDVANEALNENGTLSESVFLATLGPDYIPLAFRTAAAADPRARLYYNDFNLETNPAKAAGALKLVQLVQSSSSSFSNSSISTRDSRQIIHGVGFQAHLTVGQTPPRASLAATLSRFTALGLEVAYTELDIAQSSLPPSDADVAQQARDYVSVVGSCLDVKGCVGVTVWQFTDRYSWVPSTFPGKGDACLWTSGYQKKPAYGAVVQLLRGAVAGTGGGNGNGNGNGSVTGFGGGQSRPAAASFSSGAGEVAGVWRGVGAATGAGLGALLLLL